MDRKKSAMIRIITWSVVAVVLLGLLVAGIVWGIPIFRFNLGNIHIGIGDGFSYSDSGAYAVGSGSVPADGVEDIEVNWLDGRVNFTVYGGDEIVFQETSNKELGEDQQLRYLSKGGRLIIQYCKSGSNGFGIGMAGWNLNKELEIKIPEKLAQELGELSLDGTSTDMTAEGFSARRVVVDVVSGDTGIKDAAIGEFNMSTTSGSAYLERVTVDNLEGDTTSGSVIGSEVTVGGMAEISTTSGDAILAGTVSGASLDTVSGELKVDSSVCPGKVMLSSTSGNAVLIIPENSGFIVNYDSVSGDVNCDFPVTQKEGRMVGGDGSAKFEIDTVSGDVDIRKR